MKPELVSFNLCPYVQRSVITLLHKKVPYDITYIELSNPPQWFNDISPLGKVPLMKVGDNVLFESAVINEYVDETTGEPLMPTDPISRAHNRAWIEFGSNLIGIQYRLTAAREQAVVEEILPEYQKQIGILENELNRTERDGPYFNGKSFSLVDTSYAPLFTREKILSKAMPLYNQDDYPTYSAWANALVDLPEVTQSVIDEFYGEFVRVFSENGSFLVSKLDA